jgi:hypothetical protein
VCCVKTHGKRICLPCARRKRMANIFVYRASFGGARQRESLCRASYPNARQRLTGLTWGGKNVCRALQTKRTTNYLFVVRQNKNARQTIFYRAYFLSCVVENAHNKAPLCRATENMRTAKIGTHGNHHFSRCVNCA